MPWGDRYDLRGALIGVGVLLIGGVGVGIGLHVGTAAWLVSFSVACAAMNVTANLLRTRAKRSGALQQTTAKGRRQPQPITAAEFRRRLPIVTAGIATAVVVAVAWTLALGKSAAVPAAISGALIAVVMLAVMLRRPPIE